MNSGHPEPRFALESLAATTAELRRAVETGDFPAAGQALDRRHIEIEALRAALAGQPLSVEQLDQLGEAIRDSADAARLLVARRETARADLAQAEATRRRLPSYSPTRPGPESVVDVSL